MIIGDNLDQLKLVLPEAEAFLREHSLEDLADGRYELGNGHYANVSTYAPAARDSKDYEAHRKYADIQYVFEGLEIIEVANLNEFAPVENYDEQNDFAALSGVRGTDVILAGTTWVLVMPEDAHKPGIAPDPENPGIVRKIVFKMAL